MSGAIHVNCQIGQPPIAPDAFSQNLLAGGRRFLPTSEVLRDHRTPFPSLPLTRVLMIDNFDSFTFNLVQYLRELGAAVDVYCNDVHDVQTLLKTNPSHIMLSPGPGTPDRSGVCRELCELALFRSLPPLLGVCLGHQCLCWIAGARVEPAGRLMHGKSSLVHHDGTGIFSGIRSPFSVGRYHSLIVDTGDLAAGLRVTAHTELGEPMAVAHQHKAIFGVQFHPESILTEMGHQLLSNFLACKNDLVQKLP